MNQKDIAARLLEVESGIRSAESELARTRGAIRMLATALDGAQEFLSKLNQDPDPVADLSTMLRRLIRAIDGRNERGGLDRIVDRAEQARGLLGRIGTAPNPLRQKRIDNSGD